MIDFIRNGCLLPSSASGTELRKIYARLETLHCDNPLYDIFSIESKISAQRDIDRAYATVLLIVRSVRQAAAKHEGLMPYEKMGLIYEALDAQGIKLVAIQQQQLLTENLNAGELDCDMAAFVVAAVAHELGWPVHLVKVPKHVFVRWDDGSISVNRDPYSAQSLTDDEYAAMYHIPEISRARGVYLKNLNRAELMALVLRNRGNAQALGKDYQAAMADYTAAIERYPAFAEVHYHRGGVKRVTGDFAGALVDLSRALELFPHHVEAHIERAMVLVKLGRDDEANQDLQRAMLLDPSLPPLAVMQDYHPFMPRRLESGVQLRVPLGETGSARAGLFIGALWKAASLSDDLRLAVRLEGAVSDDAAGPSLSLVGALALIAQIDDVIISLEGGGGYRTDGGPVVRWGGGAKVPVSDAWGISVALSAEYAPGSETPLSLLPTMSLTYSF